MALLMQRCRNRQGGGALYDKGSHQISTSTLSKGRFSKRKVLFSSSTQNNTQARFCLFYCCSFYRSSSKKNSS